MTVLRQFARCEATDTGPVPLGTGAMKVKGVILNQVQNDRKGQGRDPGSECGVTIRDPESSSG